MTLTKKQQRYPLKRKPGRTRPNLDEAGATPPFDPACVTASVGGSLPPQSRAARDPFSRVPVQESRSSKTAFITPRKGEKEGEGSKHLQNNPRRHQLRFMISRASNASWTGMPNSMMILVSLPVASSWLDTGKTPTGSRQQNKACGAAERRKNSDGASEEGKNCSLHFSLLQFLHPMKQVAVREA